MEKEILRRSVSLSAMNPKNIIRLLQEAFDQPHDFESAVNNDERTFSFQLETLIKDSINDAFFCRNT